MTRIPRRLRTKNRSHNMCEQIESAPRETADDSEQFFLDDPFVFWLIMIGLLICVAILIGCFAVAMRTA